MNKDIADHHQALSDADRQIAEALRSIIDACLPEAESKVWHAHPVWFLDGNPVVGYSRLKAGMRLLFWSGQSFEEEALRPEGKFKAAQAIYTTVEDIRPKDLKRWLSKACDIQWDYKNIVKRKGELVRLK